MTTQADASQNLLQLARPEVAGLAPYVGGRPIEEVQRELGISSLVKLASNENPRGPSQRVLSAMQKASLEVNRYPDGNGYYLKQALAEYHGVEPECITLGNGSNDILELIAAAYLGPHANAVYSEYSFVVYQMVAIKSGAESRVIPAAGYAHDLDAMAAACDENTRVLFLANPNNPTGTCFAEAELVALLQRVSSETLVILDEAYFDYATKLFAEDTSVDGSYPQSESLLAAFPNLVVTRSFSKIYGLGGLRLGYSLSNPAVADVLNRARQPFNVNAIALAAGLAAINDVDYVRESVELNNQQLSHVTSRLSALGIETIRSYGNFIVFSCVGLALGANQLEAGLLARGVILRGLAPYKMPNHLRVSIGLEEENALFLKQLEQLLND